VISPAAPDGIHKLLRDRLILQVEGYNTDPREVYEIPEVRDYWRKLQDQSPTLLFFAASAHPSALQAIFACIAPRLDIVRNKDGDCVRVCLEGQTLKQMLAAEMATHFALNMRLGLKPHEAMERLAKSLEALLPCS
jgi:hypothetical protein